MTFTVIQDNWDDDDDLELLEYLETADIPHKILSRAEISSLKLEDISPLFADTDIVQKMIHPKHVPHCYPPSLSKFYHRTITVVNLEDIPKLEKPYFIKPRDNNKSFETHNM